jgi:putative flippase GtrA
MHRIQGVMRSASVGAVATLLDLAVLTFLVRGLSLSPRLASPLALAAGIAAQFVGNKLFAFDDKRPEWVAQGLQFLSVEALGAVSNLVLFDWLMRHAHLGLVPARLLSTSVVYFAICLPLWARIFRAPLEQRRAP